ncbi:hypothetical protein [Opitutus terrae]|uniref:Outer membrane protein beta-barrel domain-containing protein n=1 Tax=Opitutus terrae (strain DSM 11246 / JCM 15787 / PB90-1) TaxID=452637 RepID=B1ZZ42_OPITP|nr:hypothetical protein [Opitutus terrae]ACB77114.1 hypothetical protein Oter_3840 [Opitutus terrae PB90-1]
MKFFLRVWCVLLIAVSVARAQYEDEENFGDYKPTLDDDLIQYVPKYTVRLGFRGITGVKSQFGGQGTISPAWFSVSSSNLLPIQIGSKEGVAPRVYHDGFVGPDGRTVADPAGNAVPISPDGFTNTWAFRSPEQATEDGLMAMHVYTATLTDTGFQEKKPPLGLGVEVAVERDFGKIGRTRLQWGVIGGMSVNQFNAIKRASVNANINTTTDYYSLNGQTVPDTGTAYPQFAGGADVSVLLGNEVLARTTTVTPSSDALTTRWQSRGAYVTLRGGPTLLVPFGERFSASFSAGAVIVYAGAAYSVTQNFTPATGDDWEEFAQEEDSKILPGFYVDANLQWTMTETSGIYLGAVYQNSGDFTQEVTSNDKGATYTNRVDLSKLQGIRAGMNFRF